MNYVNFSISSRWRRPSRTGPPTGRHPAVDAVASALTWLALVAAPLSASASTIVDLKSAGSYAILGYNILLHNCTVWDGPVGVGYGDYGFPPPVGTMQVESPGIVKGVTYRDPSASITGSTGPSNLQGGIVVQELDQAFDDALAAYNLALTLTPDHAISGDISAATTITATHGGQYVVLITGSIKKPLYLQPHPSSPATKFVVIVNGTIDIGGSDTIGAPTAAGAKHVLFVIKGTGSTLKSKIGNKVYGTMLAPFRQAEFHGFDGSFIGGKLQAKFMSGAQLYYKGFEPVPYDFGDLPDVPFPTLLANNGPRHLLNGNDVNAGLKLGTYVDAEPDGQPNSTATGDDANPAGGPDDEDGIAFTPLTAGQVGATLTAAVANAPSGAFLQAWIDFNNNGIFEAGEQIANNLAVVNGANVVTFNVPTLAATGTPLGARFRLSTATDLGPVGEAPNGEVEDYLVVIQAAPTPYDFGDLPSPYPTLIAENGPQHPVGALRLGQFIDAEANGQPTTFADGDDVNGSPDDEDGVNVTDLAGLTAGRVGTVQITVTGVGSGAVVNAFFDWNNNGVLNDPGEAFTLAFAADGTQALTVTVPAEAVTGIPLGARFRVSSTGGLGPTGLALDGEVEDYLVTVAAGYDYGDLTVTGTTFNTDGANAPRHFVGAALRLGTVIDSEPNGQPSVGADGDDLNPLAGPNDEDGVSFGLLMAGQPGTISVDVSGTAGGGLLNAWVDWNDNGTFDVGEQIFANTSVVNGLNLLTVTVPPGAVPDIPLAARFRLSSAGGDSATSGAAADGEIEDYLVTVLAAQPLDFGDAPTTGQSVFASSYPTLLADGAARHIIVSGFSLGPAIDAETDGQPTGDAYGDDLNGTTPDDEDGVFFTTSLIRGKDATVVVMLNNAAGRLDPRLDAWIDWNQNGVWEPAEEIVDSAPLVSGWNSFDFSVPSDANLGSLYARFRLSDGGGLTPSGLAASGEVEDYLVFVTDLDSPSLDWGDLPEGTYKTLSTSDGPRHNIVPNLRLGLLIDAEANGQPSAAANGDDSANTADEDGVNPTFLTDLIRGQPATIPVSVFNNTGGQATLWGWLDWNNDGVVNAGETQSVTVPSGAPQQTVNLNFTVPLGAAPSTYARFRLASNPMEADSPTGAAASGEVEDYVVTTKTPPPTAARLAYFKAVRAGEGLVQVTWGTLVENGVLGFRVERSTADGGWQRLTAQMIPATGWDGRPQSYGLTDASAPAEAGVLYRLLETDLSGRERCWPVAAVEAGMTTGIARTETGLEPERGAPNASVTVQTAKRSRTVDGGADGDAGWRGAAVLNLGVDVNGPARFYRVVSGRQHHPVIGSRGRASATEPALFARSAGFQAGSGRAGLLTGAGAGRKLEVPADKNVGVTSRRLSSRLPAMPVLRPVSSAGLLTGYGADRKLEVSADKNVGATHQQEARRTS
ncbi:MAG: hypothetical protein IPM17_07070 [Verrucomicrobia bacterium]|nr:hypothetical protein [Verrucomicrobiota bacterium]